MTHTFKQLYYLLMVWLRVPLNITEILADGHELKDYHCVAIVVVLVTDTARLVQAEVLRGRARVTPLVDIFNGDTSLA